MIMKITLVAGLILGLTSAAPQQSPPGGGSRPLQPEVVLNRFEQENPNPNDGSYRFLIETSDGTRREESGALKQIGTEQGIAVQGTFTFVDKNIPYTLTYKADEGGFQPQGTHLPEHFAPEISEPIQKGLAIIFRNAQLQRDAAAAKSSRGRNIVGEGVF